MLRCRKLNKQISLSKLIEEENLIGDIELKEQEIAKIWANIVPLKGKEYLESKKIQSSLTYKITIRYRKDIDTSMTIHFKDKKFLIQDVINIKESNKFLELMCIEKGDVLNA